MIQVIFRLILVFGFLSCATKSREDLLVSPFESTVPGTRVSNVHLVDSDKGKVYRGMRLRNKEDALNLKDKLGMSDVLIFRASSNSIGIKEEIAMLQDLGYESSSISHIPFEWNKTPSFKEVCEQSFQALELMHRVTMQSGRSLYVHCTVGEDRTGYIAGLYKMTFKGISQDEVFRNEMCAHGYADANSQKPQEVTDIVHANVTVTFVKMSYLLRTKAKRFRALDKRLCEHDPSELSPQTAKELATLAQSLRCRSN